MAKTKVSIDVLKVHPRNQEFFDDISGEDYSQFKTSIKEDGILTDLIVAPDMTILSGHQRYKAAKELGIKNVPVQIRDDVETDDQKLKILLAANFGRNKNDDAKKRKIAAEYVALCGYNHGGSRKSSVQNEHLNYQEIADQLGTSVSSLRRSLRIERNLTEDMKQLLDDGVISETFAADVIAAMSEEDQIKFVSSLDATKKYTAKELSDLLEDNKLERQRADKYKLKNDDLKQKLKNSYSPKEYNSVKNENEKLRAEIDALKKEEKPPFPISEEQLNSGEDTSVDATDTIDVINSPEYQELLKKYNNLISQHDTDQDLLANKDADIQRLQLSMDDDTYHAAKSNKILAALSRVNSVIKNELLPLLYDNDLGKISEVMCAKVEESLLNNIEIMNKCIMDLNTGNYIDIIG